MYKDIEPQSRVFLLLDRMKHQLCGFTSLNDKTNQVISKNNNVYL